MACSSYNANSNGNGKIPKLKLVPLCDDAPPPTNCKSRELVGSVLLVGCNCLKRNGLQDDCRRKGCQGQPQCLATPIPCCMPAKCQLAKEEQRRRQQEAYEQDRKKNCCNGQEEPPKQYALLVECAPCPKPCCPVQLAPVRNGAGKGKLYCLQIDDEDDGC